MAIDAQANIYVNGNSTSTSGVASPDAFQPNIGGGQDATMAKFDSAGHRIWSTYFGGTGLDDSYDMEVDSAGKVYLDLDTFGPLPVTSGSYQTIVRGQDDLAVFEFDFTPCTDANEPNESYQSPHVIADSITASGTTINGAISSATDQDWFSIHLNTISSVTITLTGLTKNYDLTIFDSTQAVIATSTNTGTSDEGTTLSNVSGTFKIQIVHDSLNYDQFNCYSLHISTAQRLSETIPGVTDQHLKIYPNPSTGLITATLESSRENDMTILVFDAIGRIVFSQAEHATEGVNTFSLNLSELNAGMYVLQVQGGDVRDVTKFTIEK